LDSHLEQRGPDAASRKSSELLAHMNKKVHRWENQSVKPQPATDYNPLARVPTDETPRSKAWAEACRIAEWIRIRHPKAKVLAFGSIVRPGAWSPRSDIDLALSSIPDLSWKFQIEVQDAFPTYRVQVIERDGFLRRNKGGQAVEKAEPETVNFHKEVLQTGVELPSAIPMKDGPPELLEIPRRLDSSLRHAEGELKKLLEAADNSRSNQIGFRGIGEFPEKLTQPSIGACLWFYSGDQDGLLPERGCLNVKVVPCCEPEGCVEHNVIGNWAFAWRGLPGIEAVGTANALVKTASFEEWLPVEMAGDHIIRFDLADLASKATVASEAAHFESAGRLVMQYQPACN
jgi:predicted nucleotidyltransferase